MIQFIVIYIYKKVLKTFTSDLLPRKATMFKTPFKAALFLAFSVTVTLQAKNTAPLNIWIMPNGASPKEALEQNLAEFTKKTGIPTNIQILDWGEAWNKISITLKDGKDLPDIIQLGSTWIPYFAIRGEIKPLNYMLKDIDSTRFVPVSWNSTHMENDTNIYSIPWFMDVRTLLCNNKILAQNGISKESVSTIEGFRKAIKTINDSKQTLEDGTKIHGFMFPGKSDWNIPHNFSPWIWGYGGDLVQKDSSGKWHAGILSKETLLGISTYLNFIFDSLVDSHTLQYNTAQVAQQFNNGELGFIVNTSEIIMQTHFKESEGGLLGSPIESDGVSILQMPSGPEGNFSFVGGSNLAIPAANKRPEANQLLLFLTSDKVIDQYTKQIGFLPPSKNILESWALDENYRELVEISNNAISYKSIPEWSDLEMVFVSLFTAILEQIETPALYSEEKLYQILVQYTKEINHRLDYDSKDIMNYEDFHKIWEPAIHTFKEDSTKETPTTNHIQNNLRIAPWIFIIMILFSFTYSYKRKRKNK